MTISVSIIISGLYTRANYMMIEHTRVHVSSSIICFWLLWRRVLVTYCVYSTTSPRCSAHPRTHTHTYIACYCSACSTHGRSDDQGDQAVRRSSGLLPQTHSLSGRVRASGVHWAVCGGHCWGEASPQERCTGPQVAVLHWDTGQNPHQSSSTGEYSVSGNGKKELLSYMIAAVLLKSVEIALQICVHITCI